MDRAEISQIAHERHPIAAPISEERLQHLLAEVAAPEIEVLDLGCGVGSWLLTLLELSEQACGIGVDVSKPALEEASRASSERGLSDRVEWIESDAASWSGADTFDVAMCVGASHVFGGLDGTLSAIRRHLRRGGFAVLGDAFWERAPSESAQAAIPEELPSLAGLVDVVEAAGFEVVDGYVSTLQDWDDYEWSWTGSLVRWALGQAAGSSEAAEALGAAREHREAWLKGYRGELGFVTLVLVDVQDR